MSLAQSCLLSWYCSGELSTIMFVFMILQWNIDPYCLLQASRLKWNLSGFTWNVFPTSGQPLGPTGFRFVLNLFRIQLNIRIDITNTKTYNILRNNIKPRVRQIAWKGMFTRVYLLDFFCSGIQFNLLLSPYPCFISLLYLDLYVLGDDALIS